MASFVETATLKVIDQSTAQIRKINRSLADLYRSANKVRGSVGNLGTIRIASGQLNQATNNLRQLSSVAAATKRNLNMSVNVRTQQITPAMTKLQALATRAQQTNKALQNMGVGPVVTPRNVPGGRQPRQRPGQQQNPRVVLDDSGFRSFANGFMQRLGTTIETAIISGFQKGTRDIDLAQTRQRILGFTPEERARNNQNATALANENVQFSRAQILAAMGEIAPSVGNDAEATKAVTSAVLQYSKALMAAGATADEATDNLQKLSKAMGMTGTLLDNNGKFDANAMNRFMEVIVQETITGGQEMTPELIAQLAKYSRTTGKTLSQEGWRTLLFLGEDYGSSAGVGLNQMVKQLTGERVQKKQLARLMELGLMGSKEVQSGTVGGKIKTEAVSTGAVEEQMLRSDPAKWVRDILMPLMRKEGYDPTDNIQAAKFAGEITSDRTATDILTTLITNMGEVEQRRGIAEKRGNVNLDTILDESITAQFNTTAAQLTSAAGEVANSFKSVLIPALQTVGNVARNIAAFVAGPTGEGNLVAGATVAAGGLAAGYAGYKAVGMLGDIFGLKGSAVALNGSAAALTRAAVALGASGATNGVDIPGTPASKKTGVMAKTMKGIGAAATIGTIALAADQILLDGAGTQKAEHNLNLAEAFLTALSKYQRDAMFPDPKSQEPVSDNPSWFQRFLWGKASDSQYPGFKEQVRNDFGVKSDASEIVTKFGQEVAQGAIDMQTAIDTSSTNMSTKIDESAAMFGPTAGAGLLQTATTWGAAAGAALREQIGNIPITVNAGSNVDTGNNENKAR